MECVYVCVFECVCMCGGGGGGISPAYKNSK